MAADLVKIVDTMKEDLKEMYLRDPKAVWDLPMIAVSKRTGGVVVLDNLQSNEHAMQWLITHMQNDIESLVVGRMVAKYSSVLGADGKPIITEKAIMVMGRQLGNNRSYVSITPCHEHTDTRDLDTIEKENKVFDPSLKAPDLDKLITDEHGIIRGRMTAKFGKEQIMDSKKGQVFMMDPIIQGVFPENQRLMEDAAKAENLNAPDKGGFKGIGDK